MSLATWQTAGPTRQVLRDLEGWWWRGGRCLVGSQVPWAPTAFPPEEEDRDDDDDNGTQPLSCTPPAAVLSVVTCQFVVSNV